MDYRLLPDHRHKADEIDAFLQSLNDANDYGPKPEASLSLARQYLLDIFTEYHSKLRDRPPYTFTERYSLDSWQPYLCQSYSSLLTELSEGMDRERLATSMNKLSNLFRFVYCYLYWLKDSTAEVIAVLKDAIPFEVIDRSGNLLYSEMSVLTLSCLWKDVRTCKAEVFPRFIRVGKSMQLSHYEGEFYHNRIHMLLAAGAFNGPERTTSNSRRWSCNYCDGDNVSGCMLSDPQNCVRL